MIRLIPRPERDACASPIRAASHGVVRPRRDLSAQRAEHGCLVHQPREIRAMGTLHDRAPPPDMPALGGQAACRVCVLPRRVFPLWGDPRGRDRRRFCRAHEGAPSSDHPGRHSTRAASKHDDLILNVTRPRRCHFPRGEDLGARFTSFSAATPYGSPSSETSSCTGAPRTCRPTRRAGPSSRSRPSRRMYIATFR